MVKPYNSPVVFTRESLLPAGMAVSGSIPNLPGKYTDFAEIWMAKARIV